MVDAPLLTSVVALFARPFVIPSSKSLGGPFKPSFGLSGVVADPNPPLRARPVPRRSNTLDTTWMVRRANKPPDAPSLAFNINRSAGLAHHGAAKTPLHFSIAMNLDDQPSATFSEYTEFPSPGPLAARFLCFWTQTITGSRGIYEHRVLPDGCIDIVFIDHEPPMVAGPWTVPFLARLAAGSSITGARLRPGCASGMLGLPASELVNQNLPIATLGGAMQHIQLDRVLDQSNPAARRSVLAQVLRASMDRSAPFDQAVLAAIEWLSRRPHGRIDQLSHWIGISERQLHRRFSAAVGYGPKLFQSVLRFQRLLKTARETSAQQSLADLSSSAGYADQAHMTREVRRLADIRPTLLLRTTESTLQMSDLFKK